MKGVIFVIFEDFVTETWGAETFEDLLDACPAAASEPFVSPKTYPDELMVTMLTAACEKLSVTPAEALRAFGKFAFGGLTKRYPAFPEGVEQPRLTAAAAQSAAPPTAALGPRGPRGPRRSLEPAAARLWGKDLGPG